MNGRALAALLRVLMATVIGVLPVFLVGSLSVLIARDFPLDEQRLGLVAAFWGASALFSWPAGRIADRVGAPIALGVGALMSAVAAGGAAVAGSPGPLVAAMVVGGAGDALIVPGCNLAVAPISAAETARHGFWVQASRLVLRRTGSRNRPTASDLGRWMAGHIRWSMCAVRFMRCSHDWVARRSQVGEA
jgi:MFS family permease